MLIPGWLLMPRRKASGGNCLQDSVTPVSCLRERATCAAITFHLDDGKSTALNHSQPPFPPITGARGIPLGKSPRNPQRSINHAGTSTGQSTAPSASYVGLGIMNINARSAGPPSCFLLASPSPVSCNSEKGALLRRTPRPCLAQAPLPLPISLASRISAAASFFKNPLAGRLV